MVLNFFRFLFGCHYALYASGHGSEYVRDSKLRTKNGACKNARHWESMADTIGGRAFVVNIITGKIIEHHVRPT